MGRNYKPGDVIKGSVSSYEILEQLNRGAMAFAFSAKDVNSGGTVFLKKYISPKPSVEWYSGWVDYQQEMKRRINNTDLKHRTLKMLDFFEAAHPKSSKPNDPKQQLFHQVFEFITDGSDLRGRLESNPSWEVRQKDALVFVVLLDQLHAEDIVHTDLKPENVFVKDVEVRGRLVGQIKLIDMDFSVLSDKTPPWDGHSGYVGTPGYMSPEHLRGEIPTEASDAFTAGLILYELLTGTHPYEAAEKESVLGYTASRPSFLGTFDNGNDDEIGELLYRLLDPNGANRPTLTEVRASMMPRTESRPHSRMAPKSSRPTPAPETRPSPTPSPAPTPAPTPAPVDTSAADAARERAEAEESAARAAREAEMAERRAREADRRRREAESEAEKRANHEAWLRESRARRAAKEAEEEAAAAAEAASSGPTALNLSVAGQSIRVGLTKRNINARWMSQYVGDDSKFWAQDAQLDFVREGTNQWFVVPNPSATNDTILNGRKITDRTPLNNGDVLGVGRESKGIIKTPITIEITR